MRMIACLLSLTMLIAWAGNAVEVNEDAVLTNLVEAHPRLFLPEGRLQELKSLAERDKVLSKYVAQVVERAEATLQKPPLEHKLIGPRLLTVSRNCLDRVTTLALAWRWTRDRRFLDGAEANLLTVAAFPDWNPSHFLDTAEMSNAVGIGYDWLFEELSPETRRLLKTALIDLGLEPGLAVYKRGSGWPYSDFNWNQVCNGGLMVGALAIAETDPRYAKFIVSRAADSLPRALKSYDPDGAWMEGPAYWHYATRYTAFGIAALDSALGTDFGLSDSPGLRVTGQFPLYMTGPKGFVINYADSGERSERKPMPCMFWLAQKYGDKSLSDAEHLVTQEGTADPMHVVWYVPPTGQSTAPLALDRHFRSTVDVVVMRSSWTDPDAIFLGAKAGFNQVNHGHLDLGNFEFDALGVRWARDLGSDNYNLPGYWDKKVGGKRWEYFRLATASHNVPMIAGRNQNEDAVSTIERFDTGPMGAKVSIDLTSAYSPSSTSTHRTIGLINERKAVAVRDHFVLADAAEVVWGMTTDAEISIASDGSAVLTQDGRRLHAHVIEPNGATFSSESAEQMPPQETNVGVRRLVAKVKGQPGPLDIVVVLAPEWEQGAVTEPNLDLIR